MTRIQVYDLEGNSKSRINLPDVFKTSIMPGLIKRAVLAQQSHRLQPQGRDPMAGKRTSAITMGTGFHLSRVPRVKGRQSGAFAPSTVGGRTTHPPMSEKRIYHKINHKERRLAIRSAIAATADKSLVSIRGHLVDNVPVFPLIVVDDIQEISKVSDVKIIFEKLGLLSDLIRVENSFKTRAGKGTRRIHKKRHSVGPLFVIEDDKGIRKALRNLPGVDVVKVDRLNAEILAPGASLGRLTVWTSSAVKKMEELFS